VNLVNPFTASFDITKISSSVTSHGLVLGSIETTTNFPSAGKSTTTSPPLDLNMNFDPPTLFTLTRVLAVQAGLDPTPLDGVVALGGYSYVTATTTDSTLANRRSNIYTYECLFSNAIICPDWTLAEASICPLSSTLLSNSCALTSSYLLSLQLVRPTVRTSCTTP
jgi:hypothetical protein